MPQLWGGRFVGANDPLMVRFNASLPFDWRLWDADITGSVAWARAICAAGLLTEPERDTLMIGLNDLRAEIAADPEGTFAGATDEDIHSYVERRLSERLGEVAGKLHTGRSRNDQVATDLHLWLRVAVGDLAGSLEHLILTAANRAEREIDVLMPGYTHVQPAQPVRWSHWLLSHAWPWQRDLQRLSEITARADVLSLGAGALAGCPFPIDRHALARESGFSRVSENSMDAVSDRDAVAEFLFWGALLGVHLSRWAEDLILWSSREYGFVRLADAYSTGSSLMPQKKNPDALELLRGKTGRLQGNLTAVMTMLKGLPSSYDKDLQEDKEALFDTVDTLALALPVAAGLLESLSINAPGMADALSDDLLATDLADALVRAGVPFRQSHHLVGRAVRRADELGCALRDLPSAELESIHPAFAQVSGVWDFERLVEQRSVPGGTGRSSVLAQISEIRRLLGQNPVPGQN